MTLPTLAEEIHGTVKSVDPVSKQIILTDEAETTEIGVNITKKTLDSSGKKSVVSRISPARRSSRPTRSRRRRWPSTRRPTPQTLRGTNGHNSRGILGEFCTTSGTTSSSPLLLFFYLGFLVPILKVKFEFPYVIFTRARRPICSWRPARHGGEELAAMDPKPPSARCSGS